MDKKREFEGTKRLETQERDVPTRSTTPAIKSIIEARVRTFLEEKKVFLDPTMSLQKFSMMTSTNTTYLSNTINDCFGCSFRTLLNRYRVRWAIAMMRKEEGLNKDLYKKCGFASRSTFYDSFKSITSMSPLQYLKNTTSHNDVYQKW